MKKLFFPLLVIAGLCPLAGSASCYKSGQVVKVYANTSGAYHFIYFRTAGQIEESYVTRTPDDVAAQAAVNALIGVETVHFTGSASTCPDQGSIGDLELLSIDSLGLLPTNY